jgi:hypothetical protein
LPVTCRMTCLRVWTPLPAAPTPSSSTTGRC